MTSHVVVFDCRGPQKARGRGIARYAQDLILNFCLLNAYFKLIYLIDKSDPDLDRNKELAHYGDFVSLEDIQEYLKINKMRVDVFFALSFFHSYEKHNVFEYLLPHVLLKFKPIIIGIVYDLIPKVFPHLLDRAHTRKYNDSVECLKRCDHVFAISESAKSDCVQILNLDPEKVSTIMGSIDISRWTQIKEQIEISETQKVLNKYQLNSKSFFLYVGNFEWRKNLRNLIAAYSLFPKRREFKLVLACETKPQQIEDLKLMLRRHKLLLGKEVVTTGFIEDGVLAVLYSQAKCMVFPSLYEGLGLPILESYFFTTPVIASRQSSIPEIVHSECLFDPYDPKSIASKLEDLLESDQNAVNSINYGKALLKKLSWPNIAKIVLNRIFELTRHRTTSKMSEYGAAKLSAVIGCGRAPIAFGYGLANMQKQEDWHYFSCGNATGKNCFDISAFRLMLAVLDYQKIFLEIDGDTSIILLIKKILDMNLGQKLTLFIAQADLTCFWLDYFEGDFKLLKVLYSLFYPEKSTILASLNTIKELIELEIFGFRPLLALFGDTDFVASNEAIKRNIALEIFIGNPTLDCSSV